MHDVCTYIRLRRLLALGKAVSSFLESSSDSGVRYECSEEFLPYLLAETVMCRGT